MGRSALALSMEQNARRLEYYHQLKEKSVAKTTLPPVVIEKWIQIYTERLEALRRDSEVSCQASGLSRQPKAETESEIELREQA